MSNPQQLPVGPPADVSIYVLPGINGGCPSLMTYPRRKGDTQVAYTRPGVNPTPGKRREVLWTASGLGPGQVIMIQEKATSPDRGLFPNQPFRILSNLPWVQSGPPVKGPQHGRDSCWAYEVILSDATGILARLDPEVEVKDDP